MSGSTSKDVIPSGTKLVPTGTCWACGAEVRVGSFFCAGHDKAAEAAVIVHEYGSVAGFIVGHGYGPGAPKGLPLQLAAPENHDRANQIRHATLPARTLSTTDTGSENRPISLSVDSRGVVALHMAVGPKGKTYSAKTTTAELLEALRGAGLLVDRPTWCA